MTITNKAFPFATTAEGFTGNPETADCTMSYDSGVGNPAGSLKARTFGRNKTTVNNYWEWSGTWEDLGVTSGDVVTQVRLNAADNRCTEWNVGTSATIGPYAIYDSTGTTLIATLWAGRSPTASEGGWTSVGTQSYQSVASAYQASGTSIRLRLYSSMDNGNNANAAISLQDDNFSIDIDHQAGSDDLTANSISTTPVVGTPTIGQTHDLTANNISSSPVVGTPTAGVPGAGGDVVIVDVAVAVNTSSGNQTITDSKLGGKTPKGAILILSPASTNGTAVDGAQMSVAITDGTRHHNLTFNSEHNVTATDTHSSSEAESGPFLTLCTPGTDTIVASASFVNWTTNGIVINWTDPPEGAYILAIKFFVGDDVTVHCNRAPTDLVAADTAVTITDPNFEPEFIFAMASILLASDSRDQVIQTRVGFGVATWDLSSVITQVSWGHQVRNGQTDTNVQSGSHISSNRIISLIATAGAFNGAYEVSNFTSQGFDITPRTSAGSEDVYYLAVSFGGVIKTKSGITTTPTSTGEQYDTGPSFKPQSMMLGTTLLPSIDTTVTGNDPDIGSVGLTIFDDTVQQSYAWTEEILGTLPTNNQSLTDNVVANIPLDDGSAGVVAEKPSSNPMFDVNGFRLNYSSVDTLEAKKWWYVAFEEAAGGTTDNLTANSITTTPVVGTPTIAQTHVLDANSISTTPVVDTPSIGQTHVLDANDISTTPVVGTPTASHIHDIIANSISTTPVVDTPSMGQTHVLDANDISTTPVVGTPTIGQTHVLDANDISTTPVVGTPIVTSESGTDNLTANGILTAPEVETSTIGQTHILTANSVSTTPILATPTAGQSHVLDANDVSTTPVVDTPSIGQTHVLDANDISTTPVVGTPTIAQTHVLDANAVSTTPEVETPTITEVISHDLTANSVSTTPEVETSTIGQIHILSANSVSTTPEVETSTIGQIHILSANSVSTTPVVGSPIIGGPSSINVTFPFVTTAEGFTGYPETADITLSYDSGYGNPLGSLKSRVFGRNKVGTSYWEWSGTWEDLGIPAGDTISQMRLEGADNRCTEWTVGDAATIGPYSIYDSTGTILIATLWSGRNPTGVEGSWTNVATQSYQTIGASYQDSNTTILIRLYNTLDNGNNGSAAISVYDDNISLDIEYIPSGAIDNLTANNIATTPAVETPTIGQTHILDANDVSTIPAVETPTVSESHVLSANDISTTSEVETPTIGQTHVLDANDISTTSEVENPVLGVIGEDNLIANSISTTPEVETPTIGQEHVLVAIDITTTSEVDTPTITHVHVLSSTSIGTTPVVDNPIASQIHNLSIIDISTTPEVGNPVLGVDGEDNLIANSISTIPVVDNSTIGQVHILVASDVSTTTIVGTPTLTSVAGVDNLIATSIITSPVVGAPSIGQEHVLDVTGIVTNSVVGTPAIGQIHTLSASDIQTTTVVGTPILSHIHVLSAVGISTSPVVDTPLIGQVHALGSTPVIVSPTLGNPVVGQIHILDSVDIVTNPVVGSPSWDLIEGPVVITFGVIYPEYSFTVILPEVDIKTPNT